MDQKIEIEIGTNEDSQMILEEIALDVEAEALNVVLGINKAGNIEASGSADDVRQLVANPEFIQRFFAGVPLKTVLNLIHDNAYEITGNRDRVAEAHAAVRKAGYRADENIRCSKCHERYCSCESFGKASN